MTRWKSFILFMYAVSIWDAQTAYAAVARGGMVVSSQQLASLAGVEILQQGGNAVDAAVATAFALAVVHPTAGNIGGGGFMVLRFPNGHSTSIDFRETAPQNATRDMYLDQSGAVLAEKSRFGHLAVGTPGSVAGMCLALQKYGSLSLETVLQPAIRLARDGFPVTQGFAEDLAFHKEFKRYSATAAIFLKSDGTPFRSGELFVQSDLARTLEGIAHHGPDYFYRGPIADLILAEMKYHNGLVSLEDLDSYRAIERATVVGNFKDHQIISMAPPSSGGILMIQMLNMLETRTLSAMIHNSAPYIHLVSEVMRRAFADRAKFFGDPDYIRIPVPQLLDKEYARQRAKDIDPNHASPSSLIAHGDTTESCCESAQTTHFSVIDHDGLAVAVTTTLNGAYGSFVVVEGAGFLLNNEMDDFAAKPSEPNMYGLVQSQANSIAPGKRMLSSMTPTIVVKNGEPLLVLGSPGGPTIINAVLQVFLNVIEFQMPLQDAIAAGRFHQQWFPDQISFENGRFAPETLQDLKNLGHTLQSRRFIGEVQAIFVDPQSNDLVGVADPRGEGTAEGL